MTSRMMWVATTAFCLVLIAVLHFAWSGLAGDILRDGDRSAIHGRV